MTSTTTLMASKTARQMVENQLKNRKLFSKLNAYTFEETEKEIWSKYEANEKKQEQTLLKNRLVSIKSNFYVKGWKHAHACSKALESFVAPVNSTVAKRLLDDMAILSGATNMDEFGMGGDGSTSILGPTISPWGLHCSPGGSSSGSAVSVATNSVFGSIGSDTGGSVRLPAAYCGVVGMKPTRGSVSRFGLIPYANSLDTPGAIARNCHDVGVIMDCIAGHDELDSTSLKKPWERLTNPDEEEDDSLLRNGFNVFVPTQLLVNELDDDIKNAWESVLSLLNNDKVVNIQKLHLGEMLEFALPAYYVIALSEASSNLARYDGIRFGHRTARLAQQTMMEEFTKTRSESFGLEVKRRILMGALALSNGGDVYVKACEIRREITKQMEAVLMRSNSVMVLPTSPFKPNFPFSQHDFIFGYVQDAFTVVASLTGMCAISLPVGLDKEGKVPLAIQVVGTRDKLVFQVAKAIEKKCNFTLPLF